MSSYSPTAASLGMGSSEKFQLKQARSSFGTAATELDFLVFDKVGPGRSCLQLHLSMKALDSVS